MDPQTGLQGFEIAQKSAAYAHSPDPTVFVRSIIDLIPFITLSLPGCWIRFYKLGKRGLFAFIMANITAAFTAYIVSFLAIEMGLSQWMIGISCGMAGYSGGAGLDWIMRKVIRKD